MSEERAGQATSEPRTVTIKDVASRAGVGLGTVSRVLNGNENVAPQLRDQVFRAVQELGYRPNSVARSMRLGKSYAVGCLVTDIRQPIAAEMIAAAETTLGRAGYTLIVASTHFDNGREAEILSLMQNRVVDGMLLTVNRDNDPDVAQRLAAINIPMVLWERSPSGGFDTVLTKHRDGARSATAHLLELGHHEIALVAGHLDTWVGREQKAGFDAAFADHGLEPAAGLVFEVGLFKMRELEALFRRERPITAIIANIDEIPGILRFCAKRGLMLPGDLSIVSIGDASILEVMTPSITAVRGNGTKVAQLAANLLLKKMSDKQPETAPERLTVGMQLKVRRSTAPLGTGGENGSGRQGRV